MRQLYRWVARWHIVFVSFLFMIVASVVFAHLDQCRPAGAPSVVSLELAFTAAAFGHIVASWGAEGVRAYRDSILYVDYWFPIAYALFLSSSLGVVRLSPQEAPNKVEMALFALPICAAALDWAENTLHLVLLHRGEAFQPKLVCAASCAAMLKWGLLMLVAAAIVSRLLVRLCRR